MANRPLSGYYRTPEWSYPGTVVADEEAVPLAAVAAANPHEIELAQNLPDQAPVQLQYGVVVHQDHENNEAHAVLDRWHAVKVLAVMTLHLLAALALFCIYNYVPSFKSSTYRKDAIPDDPTNKYGHQRTPYEGLSIQSQQLITFGFFSSVVVSFNEVFNKDDVRDGPLSTTQMISMNILLLIGGLVGAHATAVISLWMPFWTICLSLSVTAVLMSLSALVACNSKLDISHTRAFWALLTTVVLFLSGTIAAVRHLVAPGEWIHRFILLSIIAGIAVKFMWDCQLIFGGKHERMHRVSSPFWSLHSYMLSIAIFTNYLLTLALIDHVRDDSKYQQGMQGQ